MESFFLRYCNFLDLFLFTILIFFNLFNILLRIYTNVNSLPQFDVKLYNSEVQRYYQIGIFFLIYKK